MYGDGKWHLYNIKKDPGETRSLEGEQGHRATSGDRAGDYALAGSRAVSIGGVYKRVPPKLPRAAPLQRFLGCFGGLQINLGNGVSVEIAGRLRASSVP